MQHKSLLIYEKDPSHFAEDVVSKRSLVIEVRIPTDQDRLPQAKLKGFSLGRFINKFAFLCLARVGKTSLSTKFVHGQFDKQQSSTVDASYLEKVIQVGEKRVKMVVWDTAGQEKYHALAKNYYQGASGALLVYDVTDEDSF